MDCADQERYTLAGPYEVERRIARDQQRVCEEVALLLPASRISALVLAGGYGRGEGGYRRDGFSTVPYNDYDYFLVVQGVTPAGLKDLRVALHALAERLSREFDLEVDFAVLESERLARLPACLMYSELKWRHRVLLGNPQALDAIQSPPPGELPLAEFSRMMLNRGALLLMNARTLAEGAGVRARSCERFLRYFSKGLLAAGDARLAAVGRYHPSVAERGRRLREIDWVGGGRERFLDLYEQATRIKLGGDVGRVLEPGEPLRLQRLAVHEWLDAYRVLETARLGCAPDSWQAYAAPSVSKGQGKGRWWSPVHHVALALASQAGRRATLNPRRVFQHPRERLMAALPLLLEPGTPGQNRLAAEALGAGVDAAWPGLAEIFLADWRRYC
jgi:hypothetical protein